MRKVFTIDQKNTRSNGYDTTSSVTEKLQFEFVRNY